MEEKKLNQNPLKRIKERWTDKSFNHSIYLVSWSRHIYVWYYYIDL